MMSLNQKSIVALIALGLLCSTALVDISRAQTGARVTYGTSNLINFQYRFWAHTGPPITGYADPVPYGNPNNLDDDGWIWTPDRHGNGAPGSLTVDFGTPQVITSFRMYSVYNGGARGADLLVEHSDDGFSYSSADGGIVDFTTSAGGGVNNAGMPLNGTGGWYEMHINPGGNSHQFWRISHSGANTTDHLPRVGEVEFYSIADVVSPPTAVAGLDQSIRAGDTVFLDGSNSFDDNTASAELDYCWSFSMLPAGSTAVLSGADTATPNFVADFADTYVVQLIVTDEGGLSSVSDEVVISSDNLAPTAEATADVSLAIVGDVVNFDGSGSTDPDVDPLTYSWTITASPAGSTAVLGGANTVNPSLTPDLVGDYEVTLTVSDCIGEGTPDTMEITATTATGFAEIQIIAACDLVEGLSPGQLKTKGNQRALCNFLRQAIRQLQNGEVENALDKLGKALDRTDGCVLRGTPDGNGPGMDWITDCQAQTEVYGLITEAINALEP